MREPPTGVADPDVLAAVRQAWSVEIDAVEHLPVGFGAHHWAASADGRRRLFVTLDRLGALGTAAGDRQCRLRLRRSSAAGPVWPDSSRAAGHRLGRHALGDC